MTKSFSTLVEKTILACRDCRLTRDFEDRDRIKRQGQVEFFEPESLAEGLPFDPKMSMVVIATRPSMLHPDVECLAWVATIAYEG